MMTPTDQEKNFSGKEEEQTNDPPRRSSSILAMRSDVAIGIPNTSFQPSNTPNINYGTQTLPHSLVPEEFKKDKMRRRRRKTVLACLVLVGVVVALIGILAGATSIFEKTSSISSEPTSDEKKMGGKSSEEQDAYFEFLVEKLYGSRWVTLESTAPQRKAIEWLAYEDPLHLKDFDKIYQRYALATIYFGQGGPLWALTAEDDGWMVNTDGMHECKWKGIDCDTSTERVIGLRLGGSPGILLTGEMVPEVGLLSDLEHLHVSYNRIKGSIPEELYSLTNLSK
jgi:hypothetical protein